MPDDRKITQFFGARGPKAGNGNLDRHGNGSIETGGKKGSLLNAMLGVKSGEPKEDGPKDDPRMRAREDKQPKRGFLAELAHRMSGAQSPKPQVDEPDDAKGAEGKDAGIAKQNAQQPEQEKGGSPRSPFPVPTRRGASRGRRGTPIGQAVGAAAVAATPGRQQEGDGYRWDMGADPDAPIEMSGFYVLS